jgi:hypothetical protein
MLVSTGHHYQDLGRRRRNPSKCSSACLDLDVSNPSSDSPTIISRFLSSQVYDCKPRKPRSGLPGNRLYVPFSSAHSFSASDCLFLAQSKHQWQGLGTVSPLRGCTRNILAVTSSSFRWKGAHFPSPCSPSPPVDAYVLISVLCESTATGPTATSISAD